MGDRNKKQEPPPPPPPPLPPLAIEMENLVMGSSSSLFQQVADHQFDYPLSPRGVGIFDNNNNNNIDYDDDDKKLLGGGGLQISSVSDDDLLGFFQPDEDQDHHFGDSFLFDFQPPPPSNYSITDHQDKYSSHDELLVLLNSPSTPNNSSSSISSHSTETNNSSTLVVVVVDQQSNNLIVPLPPTPPDKQQQQQQQQQGGLEEDDLVVADNSNKELVVVAVKPKKKKRHEQSSTSREERFAFMTKSQVDNLEDGYRWRKYGQKAVKNSPFPRSYYRCTSSNCGVKKRVERCCNDSAFVVTTYEGQHIHPSPTIIMPRGSAAGTSSSRSSTGTGGLLVQDSTSTLPRVVSSAAFGPTMAMHITQTHRFQQQQPLLPWMSSNFQNLPPPPHLSFSTSTTSSTSNSQPSPSRHFVQVDMTKRFCTASSPSYSNSLIRDHGLLQDIVPSDMIRSKEN